MTLLGLQLAKAPFFEGVSPEVLARVKAMELNGFEVAAKTGDHYGEWRERPIEAKKEKLVIVFPRRMEKGSTGALASSQIEFRLTGEFPKVHFYLYKVRRNFYHDDGGENLYSLGSGQTGTALLHERLDLDKRRPSRGDEG